MATEYKLPYTASEISKKLGQVSEKVTSPQTAKVGQTIVVKAVDDYGNPTEWEAVDFPKSVQSDTDYSTYRLRNIAILTEIPTEMNNGDIALVISE